MLFYLSYLTHTDQLAFFRLFGYLSFRAVAAVMTALLIAFLVNPLLIRCPNLKQAKGDGKRPRRTSSKLTISYASFGSIAGAR